MDLPLYGEYNQLRPVEPNTFGQVYVQTRRAKQVLSQVFNIPSVRGGTLVALPQPSFTDPRRMPPFVVLRRQRIFPPLRAFKKLLTVHPCHPRLQTIVSLLKSPK